MKTNYRIWAFLPLMASLMVACEDLSDNSYYDNTTTINENEEIRTVNESSYDYLSSREDLSSMTQLLSDNGIFKKLGDKGQLHTIFVVTNDNYVAPESEDALYMANSHVTDIAVSPSKLNNGDRLLMWHSKYVTVAADSLAEAGYIINHISFNEMSSLSEVIKTNDGFIYVISGMINTPQSLEDFINDLPAEYSQFQDMVLASGGKTFDKANSVAVGVDDAGNTLYDSVFIYTNDFFDKKNFNLSSEAIKATVFAFSNEVINKAMYVADSTLRAWNYRSGNVGDADYIEGRSDSIIRRWILEVAFYNSVLSTAELDSKVGADVKSLYDRVWRPSVQHLDLSSPVSLSNGVAYYVTGFKIPTNVLIYRLKESFYYYEYCSSEQKTTYFKADNLVFSKCNTDVAAWTPEPGVWPAVEDRALSFNYADAAANHFKLDFTPITANVTSSGTYDIQPVLLPPGEYRLALGFKQGLNLVMDISLCTVLNGDTTVLDSNTITTDAGVGTAYHYDRGATLSNTYPEGYAEQLSYLSTLNSKAGNYDTDGGLGIAAVTVPDLYGNGSAVQVLIRIECSNLNGTSSLLLNHWCFRPTINNY